MIKQYDTIIIGAGEAGLFAAYELVNNKPNMNILVIEKGSSLNNRHCPIVTKKVNKCVNCKECSIMNGFGGAGAFSDGKFNFTTEFGGWLTDYISKEECMKLINEVDEINMKFGATDNYFSTDSKFSHNLEIEALKYDLHLLHAKCKHLGTENNLKILNNIYEFLKDKIDFVFNSEVIHFQNSINDKFLVNTISDTYECKYLIAAPGRSGSERFANKCKTLGIGSINNQLDIGVRVEIPANILQEITDNIYESKLLYRSKTYNDIVRTFCMNPYGHVVMENTDGIKTVNGHSYSDKSLRSNNTNFALLTSITFTEPFNEPHKYGKHIAELTNMLSDGVIVQRFGDLVNGMRTTESRLKSSFVKPTLMSAMPGDLSLAIPKRQLDDIVEMIYALDNLVPGIANYDTLLYGAEIKFYSSRIQVDNNLETNCKNLFAIGDGAGITRGLAQAGASGLKVANVILNKCK